MKEVFDVCEIEETLAVHTHDYRKRAIVESLGLVATQIENSGAGVYYSAEAARPFVICAALAEPLPEQLMSRAGSPLRRLTDLAFRGRLGEAKDGPRLQVNNGAETLQDRNDPCRMAALMCNAGIGGEHITAQQARKALAVVDPQMVIEALLSRE